jgi:5'-methylthioadenosine phosphorylase
MSGLQQVEEVRVSTPFGDPSDAYVCGTLGEARFVFLPRHGKGHRLLPSEVNYRANVYGMKQLGVEWLVGVGAVGSLQAGIHPGDVVVPDQLIDRTRHRPSTFFGNGIVAHAMFADPFCAVLRRALVQAAAAEGAQVHDGGVYLCMEGPQFSTRAESNLYRSWGGTVIGMTNAQEAKLAREAEICFATLALVTDYDCWNAEAGDVLAANVKLARRILASVAAGLPENRSCPCATALRNAVVTDPRSVPRRTRENLRLLIGKYVGEIE